MPGGIHAAVDRVQHVPLHPALYLPPRDAGREQLGTGDDPVLPRGNRRDHRIGPIILLQTTYLVFKGRIVCHAAEFAAAAVRWVLRG